MRGKSNGAAVTGDQRSHVPLQREVGYDDEAGCWRRRRRTKLQLQTRIGAVEPPSEEEDQATTAAEDRSSGATVKGEGPSHHCIGG